MALSEKELEFLESQFTFCDPNRSFMRPPAFQKAPLLPSFSVTQAPANLEGGAYTLKALPTRHIGLDTAALEQRELIYRGTLTEAQLQDFVSGRANALEFMRNLFEETVAALPSGAVFTYLDQPPTFKSPGLQKYLHKLSDCAAYEFRIYTRFHVPKEAM